MDRRQGLRDLGSDKWQSHYETYIKDLNCPVTGNNTQSLCWLLGYALLLETKSGSELGNELPTTFLDNIDGELQF